VVSTFAALRPLLATSAHSPSETSREHHIVRERDGVIVVAGGKLTTLRLMGETTVDVALHALVAAGLERPVLPCTTADRALPGGGPTPPALTTRGLDADVTERLARAYGSRAGEPLALIDADPAAAERIVPDLPYLWAEVVQAARHEHARTIADVLARRIPLFRDARDQGLAAAGRAAAILGDQLGWDDEHRARAVSDYQAAVTSSRRWRDEI
jgi:glycerol-3-phosphate dehydrogenase